MEDPKSTPWQCIATVCSGIALLGDILAVSRSVECDLLSVLSYPKFFSGVCIILYC